MKQSKIGMIGCGMISEVYAKNITERFGDLQLVACADLRMEAAQARAEQFGTKAMTVDELLADPDIDIVLNLTIPDQHAAVSMAALKAGKNVYSEKPLAIHMQDAKELVEYAKAHNLLLGTITLVTCLLFNILAKGYLKQLSVLAGLIVGYVAALLTGAVDLSQIFSGGFVSLPRPLPYMPEFHLGAIASTTIIFLVSAAETIGDSTAVVSGALGREIETREISGSIACDGYASAISGLFGCPPVTSFSQNVGLINMTGVVNRFTIMTGAGCMILAGLLPPIGNFFASLPESVLGGCTLMMFGTILVSGIQMISKAGFSQRNVTIVALSLAIGIGFTSASETQIWSIFPQVIQDVFAANCVAVVFVMSIVLSLVLPKNMEVRPQQGE